MDNDFPIHRIQISGAALASLLNRASSTVGDIHGYLFGHALVTALNPLTDHPSPSATASLLVATVTSFLSLPSHIPLPPVPPILDDSIRLLGLFSARRKTPLRPSLKETTASSSLYSTASLSFTPQNSTVSIPPSVFILISTPLQDQVIHTHEYKAFQFRANAFESKSLNIVNLGPSFRSQYDSFCPNVQFPLMDFHLTEPHAMAEDENRESIAEKKNQVNNQKQLDMCADGFEIKRLSTLMDSEASYTAEIEDLYNKMLAKIEGLSRSLDVTNAKLLEQETHNMKLRHKVAGLK